MDTKINVPLSGYSTFLHLQLIRLLSSEQCFGAFKRSPFYARAVEELEVSDLTESPRRSAANSGDEVLDATSLSSMSLSSSPASSRAVSSALSSEFFHFKVL